MKAPSPSETNTASTAAETGLWTQKNGAPARLLEVTLGERPKRPAPGHFGTIKPADPDEVLRPLYPQEPA